MDALLLAALTIGLALLTSWLLHRSAGTSPTTTVGDEFFQRILERLYQAAPSGVGEGGLRWTQTSEEVEVSMPLEAHVKARDIEFRILPVSVALRIRGATTSLLEVFQTPEPLSISPVSPHPRLFAWQGKLQRRVKSDECHWSMVPLALRTQPARRPAMATLLLTRGPRLQMARASLGRSSSRSSRRRQPRGACIGRVCSRQHLCDGRRRSTCHLDRGCARPAHVFVSISLVFGLCCCSLLLFRVAQSNALFRFA